MDDLLEQWKIEIAKVTIDGFNEMDQNEQKIFTFINRLRCSLHFLVGLADAAEKGLLQCDKIVENGPVVSNCRMSQNLENQIQHRQLLEQFAKHSKSLDQNKQVLWYHLLFI